MAVTEKDWYQKDLQLGQKGHYQKAIQAFNQAIDNKIKFAEAYFERGVCFYKLGIAGRPQTIWRRRPCWVVRLPNFGASTVETNFKNQMKITNPKLIPFSIIIFTNTEVRHKGL